MINQLNYLDQFSQCYLKSSGNREIKFIVLHHIQAKNLDHALNLLFDHKVSCHYLIDFDGNIFNLINDIDQAYHAGYSYWSGCDGLNKSSIGIEILSSSPFEKGFSDQQYQSVINLSNHLVSKYNILPRNIIGHSDIAYFPDTGLLDRKQDPSHLFDWKILCNHNLGLPIREIKLSVDDKILFYPNDVHPNISSIKLRLKNIGYKVNNLSNEYDQEMQILARVYNRHFNPVKYQLNSDLWYHSSQAILEKILF
jgi:N-acetyl-anhydromuramyl-L-alanine amidase AmpD